MEKMNRVTGLNFNLVNSFLRNPGKTCQYMARNTATRRTVRKILKYQGVPPAGKSVKPVYFFGRYGSISYRLGGIYPIEGLRMAGVRAKPGFYASLETVRDSILVFVKDPPGVNPELLKKNGNRIVVDMRDNLFYLSGDASGLLDSTDYMIFPNKNVLNRISGARNKMPASVVLYGFPDPGISMLFRKNGYGTFDRVKACYFGYDRNLDLRILKTLREKITVTVIPVSRKSIERLTGFNMHLDLRKNVEDGIYKPLTKVLIAAECSSNIILDKTPRSLEILPENYPYFVSCVNRERNVKELKIQFDSPEWRYALSVMTGIRQQYTFRNHIVSLMKMLEELS